MLARAAVLTGLFPILALFASYWWFLDFFNHFQWQHFFTLILSTIPLLVLKSFRFAALAGVMLILPLARIAQLGETPTLIPAAHH